MERLSSETLELELENKFFDNQLRKYNDTVTWLAETLHGSMRSSFDFTYADGEIYSEDGESIETIFRDALNAAKDLPANLSFEHRRRNYEMDEFHEMKLMMQDESFNTMVVVSDFPPELMSVNESVGGYNGVRKQTMLRIITKTDGNKLNIKSQSLDLSDRDGLEAIYDHFGLKPAVGELLGQRIILDLDYEQQEFLADNLTGIYDRTLAKKFGGGWFAGINKISNDTYGFVTSQVDLVEYYTNNIIKFGDKPDLLYAVTSALKARYESPKIINPISILNVQDFQPRLLLDEELRQASFNAISNGDIFDGCGLSLGVGPQDDNYQMDNLGYGNKADQKTTYIFNKKMHCVVCQAPPKESGEPKKMCGPCGICKSCDKKLSSNI